MDVSGTDARSCFETFIRNPKTVYELKVALDMGQFSAGQINKAVPSFRNSLTRVRKIDGRHSEQLSILKKMFILTVFALSCIVETIFDNVSTAKLP